MPQMPFLMRYPREIKAGQEVNELINNVDFAPTLLDYAGLDTPEDMEGRSFREVIKGNPPPDWPGELYYRYWLHLPPAFVAHYGIRTKDYKLIFFYGLPLDATGATPEPTPAAWELYDLEQDPSELNNVYDDPSYASIVKGLKKRILSMKNNIGDTDERYPELLKRVEETK